VLRRFVRELGLAMITAGVVILLFVAFQLFGTGVAEAHSQASLKSQFQSSVSSHTGGGDSPTVGSSNPSVPPGGAIDHLVIPKIGVSKYVVQGVSEDDLRRGPGHYPQTVLPGQDGNAAIAGHRTTYGAPFFELNELTVGDEILITDLQGRTWVYKVSEPPFPVSPDDVSVLDPTPYARLTLTTCNPRFEATQRLIVIARLTGRAPLPVPKAEAHAAAAAVPALTSLNGGSTKAWPAAIAYGALVVVLWVAVRLLINRTRRWARLASYVVGIGICLVPLWFCFENVVLLLPQSI
jgi:sortase A